MAEDEYDEYPTRAGTHATWRVYSGEIDPSVVTERLGTEPMKQRCRRGEPGVMRGDAMRRGAGIARRPRRAVGRFSRVLQQQKDGARAEARGAPGSWRPRGGIPPTVYLRFIR